MRTAIMATLLISTGALAHGDAEWIQRHPNFSYCCGEHDCLRLPKGAVRDVKTGWAVAFGGREFIVEFGKELPAIDENFWGCFGAGPDGPFVRCLFVPPLGA